MGLELWLRFSDALHHVSRRGRVGIEAIAVLCVDQAKFSDAVEQSSSWAGGKGVKHALPDFAAYLGAAV